ncbi:MAG: ABC transporter ATP-binding protein [SAR324 cluster bacterium]|nr:ABC transporter ATP-binding protein [SAR324 cluster bacterium]
MYKILLFFFKSYITPLIFIIFLGLGYAVFESVNAAAIFPIVNSALQGTNASTESYGKVILALYRVITIFPIKDTFISASMLLIVVTILKSSCFLLFTIFSCRLWQSFRRNLQKRIYSKMMHADYQFFLDHQQGDLIYKVQNTPVSVAAMLKAIPDIFIQSCKIIFLLILLFTISVKATLSMLIIGILFGVLVKMISSRTYGFGKRIMQAKTGEVTVINESISGIFQILIYLNQEMWINRFKERINDFYHYKLRAVILSNTPHIVLEPLVIFAIGISGIILKLSYGNEFLEILPAMSVYAYAIIRITPSLASLGALKITLTSMLPDVETCYATMNANIRSINDGNQTMKPFNSEIAFENVSFAYPNRNRVFDKISIEIKKGQVTAIVGPSGAGKSTLMDLMVRLYDPIEGTVKVDGVDLKKAKISSWRRQIGYVSQDPFIFHDTILENMVFGQDRYQQSDIIEAAKIANAHAFISEFPDGYETIVGDKGMKLSGGQKQRIAIARAIIRKPRLIVFDEATSALDNISENMVQEAINKISKDYTVIIVAHRLSTIQNVDKIIVIDNHKVAEEGNHAELLNFRGVYWKLYNQS